ncbi:hypothetical protein BDW67DRAFT_83496 [Aspergillus spinulosporus]
MSSLDATQPLPPLTDNPRRTHATIISLPPLTSLTPVLALPYSIPFASISSSKALHFTPNSVLKPLHGVHFLLLSLLQPFLLLAIQLHLWRWHLRLSIWLFFFSKNLLTHSFSWILFARPYFPPVPGSSL